jgi:hypothetical protein
VSDCTGLLFKHQPLDRADLLAVATVDRRSFHAVAGNQGMNHGELPAFPETRENTMRRPTDPEGGIDVNQPSVGRGIE